MSTPIRLSILGAGNVGQALARAFIRKGQPVTLGVPDPAKYAAAARDLGPKATLTTAPEAIAAGDVIVLAVPYPAVDGIARSQDDWQGKVLVDATNPLTPTLDGLTVGTSSSGAETLAQAARGAHVVKAFNTTGAENMTDPSAYASGGSAPFMPVCGDNADARARVMALATLIGFEAVDLGPLSSARYLEPLAMMWIQLAFKQGFGRDFALVLQRRPAHRPG